MEPYEHFRFVVWRNIYLAWVWNWKLSLNYFSYGILMMTWHDLDVSRVLLIYLDHMVFLPSLSSCDELSLSLWGFVIVGLNISDLRTLDVCLACGYPWWQWGILLSHLMYVLVINSWIPVTLGWSRHRGWLHVFIFFSLVETLGYSLRFFVWIEYYESEIVWCISNNQLTNTCGDIGVSRWH